MVIQEQKEKILKMAIQNNPNLYTAGAVTFDSSPSVNLYGNLLARKQAKMDALDEYDRNRLTNINDTGVRDADRAGLDSRLNDLRGFYHTNKNKIRQGNSAEAYEYEKKFRDISGYINQSKERTAKQDAAMKFYQERLKQDGVIPDDFMTELQINDKGIDEEGSESFNLTKWLSSPKPFSQQTYLKSFADIKRTPQKATYSKIDGQPLKVMESVEEKFDDNAKSVIAARAADKFENSYSFREQVKNEIEDPIRRSALTKIFKDQFGIEPSSGEDFATAYTLELIQPSVVKSKAIDDKDAMMTRREKFAREIQGRIDSRSFGLASQRRQWQVLDQQAQDDYVDAVYDAYRNTETLDPQILKDYEKKDSKGHPVAIEKVSFSDDGKTVDFIVTDGKGNVDKDWSTFGVPATQIKARTRKELETATTNTGGAPKQKTSPASYKIKGKTYSEAELLKMGYTKDQISPYKQR